MRTTLPLLLALALVAGSAGAANASNDTTSRAARRAEFQQRLLDQIDTNRDGVVSRAEYQAWVDARFARLDSNGDGRVDANEIAASPQVAQRVQKRAERFVNRYDTSGTGNVSKADFEAKEMARFDRLSGGSGTLDAEQLLPRRGAFGRHRDATATPDDKG